MRSFYRRRLPPGRRVSCPVRRCRRAPGPLLCAAFAAFRPRPSRLGMAALRERRPALAGDDAKIQLAAVDVDAGDGDAHQVAQAERVARAMAGQRVRAAVEAIVVVGQRA